MGFRLDYELVVKGFLFRKGKMKIIVSKLYKVLNHGKFDQVSQLVIHMMLLYLKIMKHSNTWTTSNVLY